MEHIKQVHKQYLRNLQKHFKNQFTSSLLAPVLSSVVGSGASKTNKKKLNIYYIYIYIYKQIKNQKSKKLKKNKKTKKKHFLQQKTFHPHKHFLNFWIVFYFKH